LLVVIVFSQTIFSPANISGLKKVIQAAILVPSVNNYLKELEATIIRRFVLKNLLF
jgi:hypothetical protein